MRKRFHLVYYFIILAIYCLIMQAFIFTPSIPQDLNASKIEPTFINRTGDLQREFLFHVTDISSSEQDLAFYSKHQYITVYGDDKLIYQNTADGGIWGHSTGVSWIFVHIPYGVKELKIDCTAAYKTVSDEIPNFLLGDKQSITLKLVKNSLLSFIISFLTILYGAMLFCSWFFLAPKLNIGNSMMFVGLFSIIMGTYFINETDIVTLLLPQRIASAFLTYLTQMCMSSCCILFFKAFIGTLENVIWKILCGLSGLQFIVCLTLQFFNIKDLRDTLFITHISMGLTAIYVITTIIIKLRHSLKTAKKKPGNSKNIYDSFSDYYGSPSVLISCLIGSSLLAACVLYDIIQYYNNTYIMDTGSASRLGFYTFLLIISMEIMRYSFLMFTKGFEEKIYEKLAVEDMLTGLHNRNAYISDTDDLNACHDIMIVTFDLNNLKKTNDTLGHAKGDFYIQSAANIIKECFSEYGSCYRIGGDEFCVIIKNASRCPIEQLIDAMDTKEKEFRTSYPLFNMHIAYGYATYDSGIDTNIERTRDRADVLMYENKKASKGEAETSK